MKDKKLQNGINEIKNIKMTSVEKKQILEYILNSSQKSNELIPSPWANIFTFAIKKNRFIYYMVIPLIVALTGGGVVFASEESLPDSILYPIKVNIVEPVRGALKFSRESRASYESGLATRRMVEAEALATKGKLDQKNEEQINTLLKKHNKKLNEALDKIDESESSEQVDEIVADFQEKMNSHAKNLDSITFQKREEKKKKERESKKEIKNDLNLEIENDLNLEIKNPDSHIDDLDEIEIEEGDDEENKISKSARDNANDIGRKIKYKKEEKSKDREDDED
jgi:hypothetical protein